MRAPGARCGLAHGVVGQGKKVAARRLRDRGRRATASASRRLIRQHQAATSGGPKPSRRASAQAPPPAMTEAPHRRPTTAPFDHRRQRHSRRPFNRRRLNAKAQSRNAEKREGAAAHGRSSRRGVQDLASRGRIPRDDSRRVGAAARLLDRLGRRRRLHGRHGPGRLRCIRGSFHGEQDRQAGPQCRRIVHPPSARPRGRSTI